MSEHYASAKGFAGHWQGRFGLDALMTGREGDENYGTPQQRQDRLVGRTIDAAIVSALFSFLREDHAVEGLPSHFFNFGGANARQRMQTEAREDKRSIPWSREAFNADINLIVEKTKGRRAERERQLLDYLVSLARLGKRGPLATHRSLVGDPAWEAFKTKREEVKEILESYDMMYAEMRERGQLHEMQRAPEMPVDPRITAFNTYFQQWLEIKDSGAKPVSSIESKVKRRVERFGQCSPGVDIRDISRVMVLPDAPRTADAFCKILERMLEPKNKTAPPVTFVEPWGAKYWGQFDRMAYLVVSRGQGAQGRGMIGEIKLVGKELLIADEMSAPIYSVMREIENVRKFLPDSSNDRTNEEIKARQEGFARLYQRQQREFDRLRAKYGGKMAEFGFPPPVPPHKRSDKKRYDTLRDALTVINQNIHLAAFKEERGSGQWPREFIRTALKVNEQAQKESDNERNIPGHMLTRIGQPGDLAQVRKEMALEKQARQKAVPGGYLEAVETRRRGGASKGAER